MDSESNAQTAAKEGGIPTTPFSGKGAFICANVSFMTLNRLSGRNGLTICQRDILPLRMRSQERSSGEGGVKGQDWEGVDEMGDENVNRARAAAVPQIASFSAPWSVDVDVGGRGWRRRLCSREVAWVWW